MLRWGVQRLVNGRPPDPPPESFPLAKPRIVRPRAEDGMTVTWIGHSTVLVQLAGHNVLLDPVWSGRASPVRRAGPRRWVAPPLALDDLPPIDTVLITHNHYDHLDRWTVTSLAKRFPAIGWHVPLRLGATVGRWGARRVTEYDWWDENDVDGLSIGSVPAQHFSARTPFDRNATLWCGWTIGGGGYRVFYAGDTGYHPAFATIADRRGPFDLGLLPVGAYEPRWFMRPVHMNPEEAVRAYRDVAGATEPAMLALHWGTFKLTDEPLDEPPARTRAAWRAAGLPDDRLWIPRHGETRSWDADLRAPY